VDVTCCHACTYAIAAEPVTYTPACSLAAFNATLRCECLSEHWFLDLDEAQRTLDCWKDDYNNHLPHSSLKDQPPADFGAGGTFIPDRNRLQKLRP